MTTDKTPATLANAKHGGCVQLGHEQRSDLVPGVVRCAKCAFQLHRTNLYLQSGTVGAGDSKTEPCPNGCGPLWPVTWETWAREGWAEAERLHLEKSALSAQPSPGGQDALLPCPFCGASLTINGAGDGVHPRDSDCILAQHVVVADHAPHAAAWNRRALAARQPVCATVKDSLTAGGGQAVGKPVDDTMRTIAYEAIDRFLRNHMLDAEYETYVEHLEALYAAPPAQSVDLGPASIPDTPEVRDILGRPNFWCSPWANVLRMRGDAIPRKAEEEQAAVIRFMLNHYLANGADWAETAGAELDAIRKADSQAVGK
ncbi:hypothetical protein ABE494_07585 [Stenotrophomonas lactitubi]|uniref:hypothetical protein n=1 Tax=Stenotrophomonas lactitubi TaxID=2045214 RepID=UPI00320A4DAE